MGLTGRVGFWDSRADRRHADAMDDRVDLYGEHEHLFRAASDDEMT
ncbi:MULTISPECIES: hypothetical protein [Citrobacter]|nr:MULTISPECIES: hypothetical protein [Citrobacter]EKZ2527271.1 hypothetical protein [Citrobacter farmeri]MDM2738123.1 hypothetical protein [Citrobacter sp. Ct235]CAI9395908.1 hypothetical protein CITSP_01189 [Citrobacter sp. T1.2D-1]